MRSLKKQFEEDTDGLVRFLIRDDPLPPSHVRIVAAGIVRKWLLDNKVSELAREVGCDFTLPVLDTSQIESKITAGASVRFFMAGGVVLNGSPIRGCYVSDEPFRGEVLIPVDTLTHVDVHLGKFLSAKRVFHEGHWFTTEQIIRFMANKAGGVHFDRSRTQPWQDNLERASAYFTVGNPNNLSSMGIVESSDPPSQVHLVLPLEIGHTWTCLDIELLAVAQSLVNIRCNSVPLINWFEQSTPDEARSPFSRFRNWLKRW